MRFLMNGCNVRGAVHLIFLGMPGPGTVPLAVPDDGAAKVPVLGVFRGPHSIHDG